MKTSKMLLSVPFFAAALALGALSLAPATRQESSPPGVHAGAKLYWVQTTSLQGLPGVGPTTPVEVRETRGSWALIDSNGINFGPVWLNFDEVVRYKTSL